MQKRETFLPMSRPDITEIEIREVVDVLKSGWITSGPKTAEFEREFARRCDAPCAIAVSSATAGLQILFHALGLGPEDEVITPSMTFASTVNQIALCGAKPVFVDCAYGTLNLQVAQVADRMTSRTRAILAVHFAGLPCDLDPLRELARKRGVVLIEDAAHALGSRYKGRPIGSGPNPALFSFHPIKNITTGEGGMITLHDPDLDRRLRLLRFHGIERDAWRRYGKGGDPGYDVHEPGFKFNLTDLQSALGLGQLRRLEEMNQRRRSIALQYEEMLRGVGGIDLPENPGYAVHHSWHLFVVKVSAMDREAFMCGLAEWNIGYGLHFPPCHLLSYVRKAWGTCRGNLPDTERAGDRIVSLPLFPTMTDADVRYVAAVVCDILKGVH